MEWFFENCLDTCHVVPNWFSYSIRGKKCPVCKIKQSHLVKNSFNVIFLFVCNTGSCSCSISSECWHLHGWSPPAACAAWSPLGSSGSLSHSSWWSTAWQYPPSAPQCWCSCRRPTGSSTMTTHSQWGSSPGCCPATWSGWCADVQVSDLWMWSVKYPPDGEFSSKADEILPAAAWDTHGHREKNCRALR